MPKLKNWFFIILFMAFLVVHSAWTVKIVKASSEQLKHVEPFGLGETVTVKEVRQWNIDVSPNGKGLPEGTGTVKQGAKVYAENVLHVMGRRESRDRRIV